MTPFPFNPELDLKLEREVAVAVHTIWRAWTEPEHLTPWFTPRPWLTVDAEIDLRPGGRFITVMRSPEGTDHPNVGCYLEVVPERRLVWTNALLEGFRPVSELPPVSEGAFLFTAALTFEPVGPGRTRYTAHVMHGHAAARNHHEEMGFHDGWGAALDQLVALHGTQ